MQLFTWLFQLRPSQLCLCIWDCVDDEMRDEISAAALFLTRLIGKNEKLSALQVEEFKVRLCNLLQERFQNHWFPDQPFKGQGYRCIRVNELDRIDPILKRAAMESGLKYEDLHLPMELTLWVDPDEVCCRFGEHKGSYCILASFKGGHKVNIVDSFKLEDLRSKSLKKSGAQGVVGGTAVSPNVGMCHRQYVDQSYQSVTQPHPVTLYGSSPTHCYLIPLRTASSSPPQLPIASAAASTALYNGAHHLGFLPSATQPAITQRLSYAFGHMTTLPVGSASTSPSTIDRYHWLNRSPIKA